MKALLARFLTGSFILASVMFIEPAFGVIHNKDFKGISDCFDKGNEVYSPTIGAIALKTGLIENIRFYGPYTPGYKDDHVTREYVKDSSDDPHWNIVKILFPSPSGILATETTGESNFAKYINNKPEEVSSLINYAKKTRDLIKGTRESIQKSHMELKHNKDSKKEITKNENKLINDQTKGRVKKSLQTQKITNNDSPSYVKVLYNTIGDAILNEECDDTCFYPKYSVEQIILAFFCYQFNTRADIKALLAGYYDNDKSGLTKKDVVDKWNNDDQWADDGKNTALEQKMKLFESQRDDVEKKNTHTLDDVFFLSNRSSFFSLTPYDSSVAFVSNGNTHFYDGKTIITNTPTFADCVERQIAHIFSLVLYKEDTNEYEIKTNTEGTIGWFFNKHKAKEANNGDPLYRDDWNKVVACKKDILYRQKSPEATQNDNELEAGFVNLVNLLKTLTGQNVDPYPASKLLDEKIKWVKESLVKIFKGLNPNYDYSCTHKNQGIKEKASWGTKDLEGDLTVTVSSLENKKVVFSFDIGSSIGSHGKIGNLKTVTVDSVKKIGAQIGITPKTTAESVSLLKNDKLSFSYFSMSDFYDLMGTYLHDNPTRAAFIKKVSQKKDAYGGIKELPFILRHVLKNISWDDRYTITNDFSQDLLALYSIEVFKPVLASTVKKLSLTNASIKELKGLENLTGLEDLTLSGFKTDSSLTLPKLDKLKKLDLFKASIKELKGLENLIGLERLELSGFQTESSLTLPKADKLKTLNLTNASIKELKGLETLTELEYLDLSGFKTESSLTLSTLVKLKRLNLSYASIKELKGLKTLTGLEDLNLSGFETESSLTLSTLVKLKKLSLTNASIKELKGLETLTELEDLNLHGFKTESSVILPKAVKLKKLNFSEAFIKELKGLETLTGLETLELSEFKTDSSLTLPKADKLKKLNLSEASIKGDVDLKNLTELEYLYLRGFKTESSVILPKAVKLKYLFLSEASIKEFEGLENLTGLEELNLQGFKTESSVILPKAVKLKTLHLTNASIKEFEGLENLTGLENLYSCEFKTESSLTLPKADKLKRLSLVNASIKKLEGLENLTELEYLYLSGFETGSSLTLPKLDKLKYLYLSKASIKELKGLENLTGLEDLDLSGCSLELKEFLKKDEGFGKLKEKRGSMLRIVE